jgi:Tol biopolymer transport system component
MNNQLRVRNAVRAALSTYLLVIGGTQVLTAGATDKPTDTWLGQKTPGRTPIPFAPGVVSTDKNVEFTVAFTPDGKEIYFTRREPDQVNLILVARLVDGKLTDPVVATFTEGGASSHPFISPDGKQMFFGWRARGRHTAWVAQRTDDSWGTPTQVGDEMMRVSVTRDRILYFTATPGNSMGDSFIANVTNFDSGEKERQRVEFKNTTLPNFAHPWIDPDERFIVFDTWDNSGADLYVSHRSGDGGWSKPRNLGARINSEEIQMTPTVTPDGRFLFFSRNDSIYWVDAAVLFDAKAKEDATPR